MRSNCSVTRVQSGVSGRGDNMRKRWITALTFLGLPGAAAGQQNASSPSNTAAQTSSSRSSGTPLQPDPAQGKLLKPNRDGKVWKNQLEEKDRKTQLEEKVVKNQQELKHVRAQLEE